MLKIQLFMPASVGCGMRVLYTGHTGEVFVVLIWSYKRKFPLIRMFLGTFSGILTAARLAQLGERQSAEREVASSNPGRTNTQGLNNN